VASRGSDVELEVGTTGNQYEVLPFLNALRYVVDEARKHQAAGNDDQFVAVGRAANAALLWHRADRAQNFEAAERYLQKF
jgi:hypothetical protein